MKHVKKIAIALAVIILTLTATVIAGSVQARAEADNAVAIETEANGADAVGLKAVGAALAVGLAALGGAIAMGMSIAKSNEGIARQPEAESSIRTLLMLGLVFIETVVIYALIVSILIIFVM